MPIYDGIADYYDKWSSGDAAYLDTAAFYQKKLTEMGQGTYLELGIGTGRISVAAVRDCPITIIGVDNSERMLKECEKRYLELSARKGRLYLEKKDFTCLTYDECFDGAILPFRTIGHLLSDEDLGAVLRGVFRALKPGGWFLFDHYMFQYEWALAHNDREIIMYQDDTYTICDRYLYDFKKELMLCQVTVNGTLRERFAFRWFTVSKLRDAVQGAGFRVISLMGEFDGRPWKPDSLEQIWLLGKDVRTGQRWTEEAAKKE